MGHAMQKSIATKQLSMCKIIINMDTVNKVKSGFSLPSTRLQIRK